METLKTILFPEITENILNLTDKTSEERKQTLQPLIDYIQEKLNSKQAINLNFICTHNSRRSHLSQVWAQTIAHNVNIPNLFCYSGGTETTAMHPNSVKALSKSGFKIQQLSEDKNPIYGIKYAGDNLPIIGFSKKFDDDFNPTSNFCAIITCSQADEGCPFISGAEKRIPITFEDPKVYDNTPLEEEKYLERSLQIASEMLYVFSSVK